MGDLIRFPVLGPCPVGPETVVRPLFRGSEPGEEKLSEKTFKAKELRWDRMKGQKKPQPYDIVGYEVVGS